MQDFTIPWGVGNEVVYVVLHVYYIEGISFVSVKSVITLERALVF
jgi:hypothetical protein|tara:strand:+ start:478 stop:612 length:135 start_codon:yes stop_codon:yes gene_type:complete